MRSRSELEKAGFYLQWQQKYGAEAWAKLELERSSNTPGADQFCASPAASDDQYSGASAAVADISDAAGALANRSWRECMVNRHVCCGSPEALADKP
jgi:hypothetical protein